MNKYFTIILGVVAIGGATWVVLKRPSSNVSSTIGVARSSLARETDEFTRNPDDSTRNDVSLASSNNNAGLNKSNSSTASQPNIKPTIIASQSIPPPVTVKINPGNQLTPPAPSNVSKTAIPAVAPTSFGTGISHTSSSVTLSPALHESQNPVLEVDPGVPLPAAFVPSEGAQKNPTVQAAQQQIADSFAQTVDSAVSKPSNPVNDAAVNDTYFRALQIANEQYRAAYGNDRYNSAGMQATIDAQH